MGIASSRSTVQRILRRRGAPAPAPAQVRGTRGTLLAKRPNHLWFLDFTQVGGLLRSVRVGAVVDAFSRKVLAIAVAPQEPSARFAVTLFRPLASIRARLVGYTTWFDGHRPHQGLGGRAPDEVYTGRVHTPRTVPLRAVLDVKHIDGNRDLPALRLRHAA